jgi:hypothetical protein
VTERKSGRRKKDGGWRMEEGGRRKERREDGKWREGEEGRGTYTYNIFK